MITNRICKYFWLSCAPGLVWLMAACQPEKSADPAPAAVKEETGAPADALPADAAVKLDPVMRAARYHYGFIVALQEGRVPSGDWQRDVPPGFVGTSQARDAGILAAWDTDKDERLSPEELEALRGAAANLWAERERTLTGYNREGKKTSCSRAREQGACRVDPMDQQFAIDCRGAGHKVHDCECGQVLCSEKPAVRRVHKGTVGEFYGGETFEARLPDLKPDRRHPPYPFRAGHAVLRMDGAENRLKLTVYPRVPACADVPKGRRCLKNGPRPWVREWPVMSVTEDSVNCYKTVIIAGIDKRPVGGIFEQVKISDPAMSRCYTAVYEPMQVELTRRYFHEKEGEVEHRSVFAGEHFRTPGQPRVVEDPDQCWDMNGQKADCLMERDDTRCDDRNADRAVRFAELCSRRMHEVVQCGCHCYLCRGLRIRPGKG